MTIDISDNIFNTIFSDKSLYLPKRWDGNDFYLSLKELFDRYNSLLSDIICNNKVKDIKIISDGILSTIKSYYSGHPNKAYKNFTYVMRRLKNKPMTTYRKSGWVNLFMSDDPLHLYRIRNVQNNLIYNRENIFHTPYNLRSKVSTCRYSISGYPSLYLSTSLELCLEETRNNRIFENTIVSRYQIERSMHNNQHIEISVVELGIKPQDFLIDETLESIRNQNLDIRLLRNKEIKANYLYWYPLIAASSYIRVNKSDPFASEYIVPQLLMQWVRNEYRGGKLIGIRYFSCASQKASEMGFNYVFPVSGQKYEHREYCHYLANSFKLTKPYFLHEFKSVLHCEYTLKSDYNLKKI